MIHYKKQMKQEKQNQIVTNKDSILNAYPDDNIV